MSTSLDKSLLYKRAFGYLLFSAFLFLFQWIYSLFAHGVASVYMKYAFLIPLFLGSGLTLIQIYLPLEKTLVADFRQMAIATLVVGCIIQGIFEIYGTEVALVKVFFVAGVTFIFISFIIYMFDWMHARN